MQGPYARGPSKHGGGGRCLVCFISDRMIFFDGCAAEKPMHFVLHSRTNLNLINFIIVISDDNYPEKRMNARNKK